MMSMNEILALVLKAIKSVAGKQPVKLSDRFRGQVTITISKKVYVTITYTHIKICKSGQSATFPLSEVESRKLEELAANFLMLLTGIAKPKEFFA